MNQARKMELNLNEIEDGLNGYTLLTIEGIPLIDDELNVSTDECTLQSEKPDKKIIVEINETSNETEISEKESLEVLNEKYELNNEIHEKYSTETCNICNDIRNKLKRLEELGNRIGFISSQTPKGVIKTCRKYFEIRQIREDIRRKLRRIKEIEMRIGADIFISDTAKKKINTEIYDINDCIMKKYEHIIQQSSAETNRNWLKLLWSIVTIFLSFADVCTDSFLAYRYFSRGLYIYGCLTLLFVLLATINNIFILQHCHGIFREKSWRKYILLLIIFITQSPTIVLGIIDCVNKYKQKRDFKLDQKIITARYQESYFEATPQLVLQLSILLIEVDLLMDPNFPIIGYVPQLLSSISSLAVIVWAIRFKYYYTDYLDFIVQYFSSILFYLFEVILFIAEFIVIGARVLSISILFSMSTLWTSVAIMSIAFINFIWNIEALKNVIDYLKYLLNCILNLVLTVDSAVSKYNFVFNIFVHSLENITAAVLWFMYKDPQVLSAVYYVVPILCTFPYFFNLLLYCIMECWFICNK